MLTGGAGADTFKFILKTDSVVGINRDQITDFSSVSGDKIDLSVIDANSLVLGDQSFSFIGSSLFTNVAGQLRFASAILAGDINGDGVADFEIQTHRGSNAHRQPTSWHKRYADRRRRQ